MDAMSPLVDLSAILILQFYIFVTKNSQFVWFNFNFSLELGDTAASTCQRINLTTATSRNISRKWTENVNAEDGRMCCRWVPRKERNTSSHVSFRSSFVFIHHDILHQPSCTNGVKQEHKTRNWKQLYMWPSRSLPLLGSILNLNLYTTGGIQDTKVPIILLHTNSTSIDHAPRHKISKSIPLSLPFDHSFEINTLCFVCLNILYTLFYSIILILPI